MVAGKDEPEPLPQKKNRGIEVVMWPLNPDGTWKNGLAPPKLKPARARDRRPRFEEQMFPRLQSMASQLKNVRVNLARNTLKKITITRMAAGELPRLELTSRQSGSPSLVIEPADSDEDSDAYDSVIFIEDAPLE